MRTEHDHVLGVSTSVRFNSHLISVWNKFGSNERSIKALETTIINRLSPELRPAGSNTYFYKRHDEHEGYRQAVGVQASNDVPLAEAPGGDAGSEEKSSEGA
jgi:hypothetical protein